MQLLVGEVGLSSQIIAIEPGCPSRKDVLNYFMSHL